MKTKPSPSTYRYAGIGSRKTPQDVLALMRDIARRLGEDRLVLRTGGAQGADGAFFDGALKSSHRADPELYLPWSGFNGYGVSTMEEAHEKAHGIAAALHPAWDKCNTTARALHARNIHIVLGKDLIDPVLFTVCWTPDGATKQTTKDTGGTGGCIRLCGELSIPVYNLQLHEHRSAWTDFANGTRDWDTTLRNLGC